MQENENNVNAKDAVFKSKPCCDKKSYEISNASDFTNHNKTEVNNFQGITAIVNDSFIQSNFSSTQVFSNLIFYKLSRDIPILHSALLI